MVNAIQVILPYQDNGGALPVPPLSMLWAKPMPAGPQGAERLPRRRGSAAAPASLAARGESPDFRRSGPALMRAPCDWFLVAAKCH